MSTPEFFAGVQADRRAERALFRDLFDDAAVFPPARTALPHAVTDHVARRASSYADLVGPLLLPVSAIGDFLRLERPQRVDVGLIGGPGADLSHLEDARSRLVEDLGVTLTGIELSWPLDWRLALSWGAPLSVEVPPGAEMERALSELQDQGEDPSPVRAKFRTGSTQDHPVPSPSQLAAFIRACVDHDISFKLTGGLHHAISQTTSAGEHQFGFLNIIAATRWALAHGAEIPEMESLLSQRDPVPILDITTRMSEADASVVRAFFTSYGCCAVSDPIADLAALGLIKETSV
jgi:hypothetical protein